MARVFFALFSHLMGHRLGFTYKHMSKKAMTTFSFLPTHTVFNQVPPLMDVNFYTADNLIKHYFYEFGGADAQDILTKYGEKLSTDLFAAGELANKYLPELRAYDRYGHRIEQVDYHPAYHQLMAAAIEAQLPALPWLQQNSSSHLLRTALNYLHMQADAGSGCPLTMTFAAIPVIQKYAKDAAQLLPKLLSGIYDPSNKPWQQKDGISIGMAMTEKQGGTDLRATTTRANFIADDVFQLVGHKWFCSAPMSDLFLTLAKTEKGLSCFLVPRFCRDGSRNAIEIQRLKHKLGNSSNASSEIEYRGAEGYLLGIQGRGIATILEMVALTRVDCIVGSTALMRQAVTHAIHHADHRHVGDQALIESPLMQNVLADLALEQEAALALACRLSYALDQPENSHEQKILRLLTPVGKYFVCKRAAYAIAEASEVLGGAGYIEETIMPRLYREAPVNSIWEGSGSVQCLDVLRVLDRYPDVIDALRDEFSGIQHHLLYRLSQEFMAHLMHFMRASEQLRQYGARQIAEELAVMFMAVNLHKFAPEYIADAYVFSRVLKGNTKNYTFGCLPEGIDCRAIIARHRVSSTASN
jgi:putative acyl-CoA dehydrogenase